MNRPYKDIKTSYPKKAGKYECKLRVGSMDTQILERVVRITQRMIDTKERCCGDWVYITHWRLTDEDLFYHVIEGCGLYHAISASVEAKGGEIEYMMNQMEMDLKETGCEYRDYELMRIEAELSLEYYLNGRERDHTTQSVYKDLS